MNLMEYRLEAVLIKLAQRHAPQLVPPLWQQPGDYAASLPRLAAALAGYNFLVMWGELLPTRRSTAHADVQMWVEGYVRLYEILTGALFPSFTQVHAYDADQQQPPIVIVTGTATPVIKVLASYIAPYVVARQNAQTVSEYELRGLFDQVLDELEAGDLHREQYLRLRETGVHQVRVMLNASVRQHAFTEPKEGLFTSLGLEPPSPADYAQVEPPPQETDTMPTVLQPRTPPPTMPTSQSAPPPPDKLPEQERLAPQRTMPNPGTGQPTLKVSSDPVNPFTSAVPIFFSPRTEADDDAAPRPPVPGLPKS